MMVSGILFDFDGTVVDSEKTRLKSINKVLERWDFAISRYRWEKYFKQFRTLDIFKLVFEERSISFSIERAYEESKKQRMMIEKREISLVPGFISFYSFLQEKNIPFIICSGGVFEHIKFNLERVGLLELPFVSREDYEKGKPEPDCYLLGLSKLGLSSEEVLIFDDAISGIEAGLRAGCRVVAVNSGSIARVDELEVFMKIKNYNELDFEKILRF